MPTATPTPIPTATPTRTPRPTRTPTPTPTPVPRNIYTWSEIVSDLSYPCRKDVDYTIDVPTGWTLQDYYNCVELEFEPRTEDAVLIVNSVHMPNYADNLDEALRQIQEDYGVDFQSEDILGAIISFDVLATRTIDHNGDAALWQILESTHEYRFLYCSESLIRLIVPSRAWSSDSATKRAYFVVGSWCKTNSRYKAVLERAIKSFQQSVP